MPRCPHFTHPTLLHHPPEPRPASPALPVAQRVLDAFQMEQALIFCRTNFDCDNLEKFLNSLGGPRPGWDGRAHCAAPPCASPASFVVTARLLPAGGGSGTGFRGKRETGIENPYSCVVLGGARSMDERRAALQVGRTPCLAQCAHCGAAAFLVHCVIGSVHASRDGDVRSMAVKSWSAMCLHVASCSPLAAGLQGRRRSLPHLHRRRGARHRHPGGAARHAPFARQAVASIPGVPVVCLSPRWRAALLTRHRIWPSTALPLPPNPAALLLPCNSAAHTASCRRACRT